jgi:hypothetical protein
MLLCPGCTCTISPWQRTRVGTFPPVHGTTSPMGKVAICILVGTRQKVVRHLSASTAVIVLIRFGLTIWRQPVFGLWQL